MGQKFIPSLENGRIWYTGELHCLLRSPVCVIEIGLRLRLTWCLEQLHWLLISLSPICTSNWLPLGEWTEEPCAPATSGPDFYLNWSLWGHLDRDRNWNKVHLKWKLRSNGYIFGGSWGFPWEELAPGLSGICRINSLCTPLHFVLNSNKPVTFLKTYHEEERFVTTTQGFGGTAGNFWTRFTSLLKLKRKVIFPGFLKEIFCVYFLLNHTSFVTRRVVCVPDVQVFGQFSSNFQDRKRQ
jgi:hypothetical protein